MEQKRLYETTFIINASLDDPQIEQTITRVQEFITTNGGQVTSLNKWGRKRLAYPIRKKNNGFYVVIEFSASGNLVAQLERTYQLDEAIIRYLTVQLDKNALKARVSPPPQTTTATAPPDREPLFANDEVSEETP